jgi:O-antigen ligase
MVSSPPKTSVRLSVVLDRLLIVHAILFLCLFVTAAVYAFADQVPLFAMPIELFFIALAPIALRVHAIDLLKHGAQSTIALATDHRQVLLPFLGIVMIAFATSMRPGTYLEDGDSKVVFIFALRFAMFVGGLSTAILLWWAGWRPILRLITLVFLGSVFYDLAYPGTFSVVGSRAAGFVGNPNLSALTTLLLLSMVVRFERIHLLDLTFILLAFLAVYATLSRGGMLMFGLFVLVYVYLTGHGNRLRQLVWVPIIGAIMIPLGMSAMTQLTASSEMFTADNAQRRLATLSLDSEAVYESDDIRLSLLPTYIRLIDQAPLLGHGTGFTQSMPFGPHNMYLSFWVNNGLIGLLLYLWFLFALFWLARRRAFWSGAVFALLAFAGGFFNHTIFQMPSFLILAGLVMGLSWCHAAEAGAGAPHEHGVSSP